MKFISSPDSVKFCVGTDSVFYTFKYESRNLYSLG